MKKFKQWALSMATGLMMALGANSAAAVTFDFDFRDGSGTQVGTGFYAFDDIAPGTKASFGSLTNFSWQFDLTAYGFSIGSAFGDSPSTDSLVNEGILLSGAIGSRTLTFFDDIAENIASVSAALPFPTGVQFKNSSPSVAEFYDGNFDFVNGTYTATERAGVIPLPAGGVLLLTGLVGLGLARRGRKS